MSQPALLPWQQRLIGTAALASLAIGGFFYWGVNDYPAFGAGGLKAGLMLAALWWAAPRLRSAPGWLIGAILLGTLVLAARPKFVLMLARAAWLGLPLLGAWWLLTRIRLGAKRPGRRATATGDSTRQRADQRP